jgi:hypothetical protein
MRNLFILVLLISSFPCFGQFLLKPATDKSKLKSLTDTKHNHMLILNLYKDQIDSELRRIAGGIEFEILAKNEIRTKKLNEYFLSILLKRVLVSEIEKQLKSKDLDLLVSKNELVLNTESIEINLVKEIGSHLNASIGNKDFSQHTLVTFKSNLISEALKESGKKLYQSIGNGLLKKILSSGISNSALNSVVMSIASEAFIEAGVGTIAHVLTFPLHGYRIAPEQSWLDVLKKNPEMIINPEWMKYLGIEENPWYVHGYALLRHTVKMEQYAYTLIQREEIEFRETVRLIYNLKIIENEKLTVSETKIDNTKVHIDHLMDQELPFWAIQKK